MRLMIFFDLPMETSKDRTEYARFRNYLIKNGFIMMQKSVYSKLVINNVTSLALKHDIAMHTPPAGIVELLEITENQFSRIEYLVGDNLGNTINSCDRLVEL